MEYRIVPSGAPGETLSTSGSASGSRRRDWNAAPAEARAGGGMLDRFAQSVRPCVAHRGEPVPARDRFQVGDGAGVVLGGRNRLGVPRENLLQAVARVELFDVRCNGLHARLAQVVVF